MRYQARLITVICLFTLIVLATTSSSWSQTISFAGVTNVNRPDGLYTQFDLGINVSPTDVAEAYVIFPNGTTRVDFSPSDFLPYYGEYFKVLNGSPALGEYVFTVILTDNTTQSLSDTQGPLETLPIITADQIEIFSGDGVTPTFRWPAVPGRVLLYRFRVFNDAGNEIFRTPRVGSNAYVTIPGQLMPSTNYQCRVEIHDSHLFEDTNNRSNGESRTFSTGSLPGPPTGTLEVATVPWVATAPLIPHDAYNGKMTTFKAIARGGDGT